MMILFLLVLHSGFLQFIFTTNRLRSFRETGYMQWDDSLKNCTDTGGSLITLYDEDDAGFVVNYIEANLKGRPFVWLGLRKDRINVTTWSNGKVPTMSDFTTHTEVSERDQKCGLAEKGIWLNYECTRPMKFMCQKGKNYTLINKTKNWCQALGYCRRHFTDLAIINDQQEKDDVLKRNEGDGFWIGLLHDKWRWVDQSCSTHRTWDSATGNCSIITNTSGQVMKGFECDMEAAGLCSKGNVRIKVITDPKSWEESLEYCEAKHSRLLWIEGKEDQDAVEQWLKYYFKKDTISYPLWISMRQSSVFGFWIWSDRIVSWNNWVNKTQPELSETFQCGVINEDFTWGNENCLKNLSFICEEDIVWMNE